MSAPESLDRFSLPLEVVIRICVQEDLPHLEWFGLFTAHRDIFYRTFDKQKRGEQVMLVAEANRLPIGQIWIDLERRRGDSAGVLWALRVIPWMQGMKIGSRLLRAAEQELRRHGFAWAELGVEPGNPEARRLYERLGYEPHGELVEECHYTPPGGEPVRVPVVQTVMRKSLK